jgi:hypothetical protein
MLLPVEPNLATTAHEKPIRWKKSEITIVPIGLQHAVEELRLF